MKLSSDAQKQFADLASITEGGRTVGTEDWQRLDPLVLQIFPDWYRDLVARHAVIGVPMDIDTEENQIFGIGLAEPEMVSGSVDELCESHWAFRPLIDSEYFPIGFTENGDIFVAGRELPTGVFEFQPESDGGDGFIPGVADAPKWDDISDFAGDLIPEGYEG